MMADTDELGIQLQQHSQKLPTSSGDRCKRCMGEVLDPGSQLKDKCRPDTPTYPEPKDDQGACGGHGITIGAFGGHRDTHGGDGGSIGQYGEPAITHIGSCWRWRFD